MRMLVCQQCGAKVRWDGRSQLATCDHCGTQYVMHPQDRSAAAPDGIGRDEVAVIPIREGAHAGQAYARSFIPQGWTAIAANPELTASLLSPLTMRVRYVSADGRARVARTGLVAYEHIDDTPQNAARQGQLVMPDCKYVASYRDAPTLCDITARHEQDVDCSLLAHEDEADAVVQGLVEKIRSAVSQGNVSGWDISYCKRTYRALGRDGTPWLRSVEALTDYVAIPPSQAELQLFQQAQMLLARTNPFGAMGAMFGMGNAANVEPPHDRVLWEVVFVLEVEAPQDAFGEAQEAASLIRKSYEESPAFERTKERLRDMIAQQQMQQAQVQNDAMAQMMRDNNAHWDRMSNIVRETNDYTTGVMRDMYASNAASHERVAQRNSEMIRDVNSYYANGGVVEASTSWDHVYQSTQDPDWFAATEGFELRPGIDFEELRRRY